MTKNKGDLISREALKATIIEPLNVNDACKNDWYEGYYTAKNEDVMAIDNAPTVERPQGEWIPVSDGLPKYTGLYLVSIDDVVTVANFTGNYFMHRDGGRVEVYAWQPLPEPYKKGSKEE